jgi:hypothetical protein
LEANSIRIGRTVGEIVGIYSLCKCCSANAPR